MNTTLLVGLVIVVLLLGGGMYWLGGSDESEVVQPVPAADAVVPASAPSSDIVAPATDASSAVPASPRTHRVAIKDFAFVPASLTIIPGDTVVWMNEDSVSHTVTSNSGKELTSSLFGKGETYEHTFTTAGTFSYHCIHHRTMRGTIVVR